MLQTSELKTWLHSKGHTQLEKLLLVLATFDEPCQIRELKDRARDGGLKISGSWNPSDTLKKSNGLAINTPLGWELTDNGRTKLRDMGVSNIPASVAQVRQDLRTELTAIANLTTRAFVAEAIKCFEYDLYRSAIVMSWLSAVDILYHHVVANRLSDFNIEATRIDPKWKQARTVDDLARMKETDFLDRITGLSIIGKNVRKELGDCLARRNGCGHPNSLMIGTNTVAHHIEVLILNVFQKF